MTIRDAKAYLQGIWDWAILRGCFGPKMEPTDLDGHIERNGYFLTIEAKRPGQPVPMGQRIDFENQVKTGYTTVIIVWGTTNEPNGFVVMTRAGVERYEGGNLEDLRRECGNWYAWANARRAVYFEMETYRGGRNEQRQLDDAALSAVSRPGYLSDGRGREVGPVISSGTAPA